MSARPQIGFALRYAVIAGVLFSIYAFPFELFGAKSDWMSGYLAAYARLAGAVLRPFEQNIEVSGSVIQGRYSLQIVRNCDAAEVMILLASAVLAYPTATLRRLLALPLALSSVVLMNVLRICSLFYIGVYRPAWFQAAHEQVWPLLLIVFATSVFLLWTQYETKEAQRRASHARA